MRGRQSAVLLVKLADKADTGKVAEAVEYLVDAWVRDELAPGGDAASY